MHSLGIFSLKSIPDGRRRLNPSASPTSVYVYSTEVKGEEVLPHCMASVLVSNTHMYVDTCIPSTRALIPSEIETCTGSGGNAIQPTANQKPHAERTTFLLCSRRGLNRWLPRVFPQLLLCSTWGCRGVGGDAIICTISIVRTRNRNNVVCYAEKYRCVPRVTDGHA